VRLFLDVCAAVQHAHTHLVVHRDLKPANILVDAQGSVRLLDFGVAGLLRGDGQVTRITAGGMQPAMTPEYAAPEQFGDDDDVGVSADVYSLGVILYELVCGVLPIDVDRLSRAASERAVREQQPQSLAQAIARPVAGPLRDGARQGDPTVTRLAARATSLRAYRHAVRGDLVRIVETALAKEQDRRYATVQALADDLQRWLAGSPVRVSGNGLGYRIGKFVRRNRVSVGIATASALGLVAATAIAVQSARSERLQREEATAEVARSSAVRDYLTLMFRTATRNRPTGALTADEVLKQGASDIFEHFRDQPRTGQTTALMLSELYAALGDPEGAAPLLERLLQWPGIEANPDILASARFAMATVEHHRGNDEHARSLLSAAQAYWSSRPERFLARLGASRTLQARLERLQGNTDAAIETLEQSIREFRALRARPDDEVASALVTLSITLAQAGRIEEALAQADASVVEYADLGRADTVEGLTALGNRAAVASMLGRDAPALADMHEVSGKLAVFGASEALAKADAQRGELLAKLGRFDEALPLLRDALAMAIRFGGPEGRLAAGVRQRLVQACLDAGRAAEAAPLVDDVLAQALRSSGNASRDTGIAYRQRAQLRAAQHRRDEALADLRTAQDIFEGMGANGASQLRKVEQLRSTLEARVRDGAGSGSPAR
jgi:tetratricopeptide (TPR) repeat protein